jgi:hypothetical protein
LGWRKVCNQTGRDGFGLLVDTRAKNPIWSVSALNQTSNANQGI